MVVALRKAAIVFAFYGRIGHADRTTAVQNSRIDFKRLAADAGKILSFAKSGAVMSSMRLLCGGALVLGLSVSFLNAQDAPATQPVAAKAADDADYAQVVAKRADEAVLAANIADSAKADQAHGIIARYYMDLHDLHAARDAEIKSNGYAKNSPEAKKLIDETQVKAEARVATLTEQLSAIATPGQVSAIKDKMTYNVRPITIAAYSDELLQLTEDQKAYIAQQLLEGREKALTGGTSKEKHDWFNKYKGRINIYLDKQGYDMKAESKAWAERIKQRKAAATQQAN